MKHSLDKRRRPKRRPVAFESLEPRLLLSADLAPALAPFAHDALPPIPAEHRSLEVMAELPQVVMTQEAARASELVFVDATLPDYERLVADVLRATGGERSVEVILLDPSRDGVAQIGEALASRTGLAAVHLVTHGGDGRLQLGGATLDAAALEANSNAISAWSRAFAADGDLLLYGCNVAETARGGTFIDALALLTGADVAASDDLSGAARLGGDWDLERTTGVIEGAMLPLTDAAWDGLLATEMLDWDAVAASGTNPYPASALVWMSDTIGGGTIAFSLSGDTGNITTGPVIDQFNEGGTSPVQNALHLSLDLDNNVQQVVWTIDFSHLAGVSNVSFSIFDIDVGGFVDSVSVTSDRGNPVITGSVNNSVSGNTVTGVTNTPQTGVGSDEANATFFFGQSGITQITITYKHDDATDPSGQGISLHDISFDPTPAASDRTVAVNEDNTYTFAAGDFGFSDVGGDTLQRIRITQLETAGSLRLNGVDVALNDEITRAQIDAGQLTFAPAVNANGSPYANFRFRVSDGASFSVADYQMRVNVNAVNDAPVATADGYSVAEDGTLNVAASGVLANDSDIDGPALSAVLVSGPASASAFTLNANGSFTYTPNANFSGSDSFTYRASDGALQSAPVTVTITVTAVNDAPVGSGGATLGAVAEDAASPAGATVAALLGGNYSDAADGAGATALAGVAIVGNAATAAQGVWQYSPDGLAWTSIGVALSDASAVTLPSTHLLRFLPAANFNGTPGALSVRLADGSAGAIAVATGVNLGGAVGGTGNWSAATVALGTSITAVNDAPTFAALANQTVTEDTGAQTLASFTTVAPGGGADEAGQTFGYTVTNDNNALFSVQPSIAANGTLTYTAAANAIGTATVTVFVTDSGGTANGGVDTTGPRTFTLNVTPVADTPAVSNATTLEDTQSSGGLVITRNAADGAEVTHYKITGIAGGTLYLSDGVTAVANGTFITAADGAAGLKFSPTANAVANGTFDVQASTAANNTGLGGSVVSATIAVTPVNDAPTFAPLANQTVAEDAGAQTLASFTTVAPGGGADEAGQTFSYTVTNDNNALFSVQPSIAANGTLTYTSAANVSGTATVTVFVTDSGGTTNGGVDTTGPRIFTVTTTPVADAPSVTNAATLEDAQTTSGLVITRNAADGAEVTHYKITGIAGGALFLSDGTTAVANGTFITAAQGAAGLKFTPSANSIANGTFDLQASTAANDTGLGGSVVAATITVTAVNDEPSVTLAGNQTAAEDAGAQTVPGFATATPGGGADEAGQTFTYSVTNDNNALFTVQPTIAANGILTYTSAPNANGVATIRVTLSDSGGVLNGGDDTAPAQTFTITVTAVNDAPVGSGGATLGAVAEDAASPAGATVAALLGGNYSDAADGAGATALAGVAIVGNAATAAQGVWQYSPDGLAWTSIGVALSDASAVTLPSTHLLRFLPAANFNGTPGALSVRLADGSAGAIAVATGVNLGGAVGGTGNWSAATVALGTSITAVNDAPTFAALANQTVTEDTGAQTLASFTTVAPGGGADEAGQTFGYTVTNDNNALFSVQPSIAANGTLTYTAAANAIGTATVTVFVTDSGGTANGGVDTTGPRTFTLNVTPVADTPAVSNATTLEDTQSSGGLVITRNAADGAEVTHYKITGIAGGTLYLSDGVTAVANGTFITAADGAAGLKFSPTANAVANGTFDVQASTAANNTGLGGSVVSATIAVTPVNDAPTFAPLANQTVAEDAGAQTLASFTTVAPGGGADEAGQTFSYTVTNDNNALFSVQPSIAANGTLTYTSAANVSGTATVTVFVTDSGGTTNGGVDTTGPRIFTVTTTPVADAPTLTVNPATGNEDTAIALSVARSLVDTDGSESLALTVAALPIGATLSDGVNSFTASAGNQSVAITTWNLAALTITPPANSDGDFTLTVSATATEAANGATATTVRNLAVTVDAVADAPTLTVNPAAGNEDTAIALSIARSLVDTDGSESLALTVAAIPIGATLSDGVNSFTASAGNQSVAITTWNLAALTITPPANSDGDFTLTVSATATEAANGATATTVRNLAVTVDAVADAPTLTVNPAAGNEDTAIALSVARSLVDTDGSESLALTVAALPIGATLSDGVNSFTASAGNQSVAITTWNLAALTITPPANSDVDFTLTVSATATEAANGSTATTTLPLAVTVDAVADAPTLTVNPATGNEDTAIALSVARSLVDTDGSESLALTVAALPIGATLSDGVNSFTASAGNQSVAITTWNLAALTITPPANSDVDFALTVSATATEAANGSTATTTLPLAVTVDAVADAPTLTVNPATGNEDTAIALSVARSLVDTDGSESLALTVAALPIGATLSDGVNSFTASAGNQSVAITTWNLAALTITPPANSDGDFTLTVSATATEAANGSTATTTLPLAVTVDAVADAPTLTVNPATGNEDTAIALSVARSLVDTDGSESLALTVAALPIGATLSDGVNSFTASAGNQSVAITTWNLAALTITPPANSDVDFALTVSATATEAANGSTATTNVNMAVDVVPVNDAPVLGPVALSIDPLQTVTMTGGNMSATDVDNPAASLVFLVAGATNGQFELAAAPGVAVTSFTQAQLASGAVRFVHTIAGSGPSFSIFVSDGAAVAGPGVAVVSFRAPGTESPPAEKRRDPTPIEVPLTSGALATSGAGLGDPTVTAFLRTPFAEGGAPAVTFAEAAPEVQVVLARPVRATAVLELRVSGAPVDGFVEAERIPTSLPRMDFAISAVRHDDAPPPLDIAFGSARITGMALSVGAVWWAARAGGLLASLLASTPAWRHVDPLPVLGRDDDEPEIDWNTPDKNPPEEEASEAAVFDEGRVANEPG